MKTDNKVCVLRLYIALSTANGMIKITKQNSVPSVSLSPDMGIL